MGIIARQAIWNTVFTYLGIGLGFVNVTLLYPRILASDEFGLTRLLLSVVTISAQIAQLGAENTVVRFFPYFRSEGKAHNGLLGMVLVFGGMVSALAVLVLASLHGVLAEVFSDRNALFERFGLLVLPLVVSEIYFILLRSYSRSVRRAVQPTFLREFVLRVLQTVLVLVQFWWPMPLALFLWLYVGTFLLTTILLAGDLYRAGEWDLGWAQRKLPRRLRGSMAVYSGYTLSGTVAGIVLGNLDQLMVGALLSDGVRYVAYYAVGFYFGSVIATPGRALAQVAMPFLADAWKRRDRALIQDLYTRSALVQTVAGGAFYTGLLACATPMFGLLPAEYAQALPVALIIGAAYLLNGTIGLSASVISMSKAYRMDAWTSLIVLGSNVLLGLLLIPAVGMVGAAWATLVSLVVVNIYRTWFLRVRYGLWPFSLRILVLLVSVAVIGYTVPRVLTEQGTVIDLFLRGAVAMVVYAAVVHFLGIGRDLRDFIARPAVGR